MLTLWRPLLPNGYSYKTFCAKRMSVRVPGCQKLQMTAWPGLAQDTLSICTHMATVGVKGLSLALQNGTGRGFGQWRCCVCVCVCLSVCLCVLSASLSICLSICRSVVAHMWGLYENYGTNQRENCFRTVLGPLERRIHAVLWRHHKSKMADVR